MPTTVHDIATKTPRSTARSANGRELERHERRGTVILSRRAVATLAAGAGLYALPPEGRDETMAERASRAIAYDAIRTMPESGGTVGPLPDGTTITVAPTRWSLLADTPAGRDAFGPERHVLAYAAEMGDEDAQRQILDAYNAAQEDSR